MRLGLFAVFAIAIAAAPTSARAGDDETPTIAKSTAVASAKPTAVLLLKLTTPDGTVTTFGQGSSEAAAGGMLTREIEALGFRLRSAAGHQVQVSGESDARLPIGDQAAVELARAAGAGTAWVVGIDIRSDGAIRGTRLVGATGRGAIRVLDAATGGAVAAAEDDGAGFEGKMAQAAQAAARDVGGKLLRRVDADVRARYGKASTAGSAGVAVRIRGARTWSSIAAIIRKLGSTEGITAVHAREVRRGRIALSVDTQLSAQKLAAAAERARLVSGTVRAAVRNAAEVELEIRGESTFSGPSTGEGTAEPEPSDQD